MSAPNSRKRAAPSPSPGPVLPIQQNLQQSYPTTNGAGDQMMRWNGGNDGTGFVDGNVHGANSFGLVPTQPQYPQNVATPSNSLARRPMNQALVHANQRPNFDSTTDPWSALVGDDGSLIAQHPPETLREEDNIELLEEMAQKAKREAQAKRKQIPPFVQKLSSFLEERKNEELIRWSEKGDSFIVLDEDEFAKTLIPELFKHNNYASFVRQLNMYGFHKRVGLSDNSMRASERKNKSPSEYSNPYFRRGHPNLLWLINKPKSGSKGRKGQKNIDGDVESEEEVGNEDILGQGLGTANVQRGRSLPPVENQPLVKKEMAVIREELNKVREQQKLILTAINRLQRNNTDLYSQAVMFQNQHDRHQNSINAILNFLANVFRKTLEDQGNTQNVSEIISSMITNQAQQGPHQGSVVDLGDFIQSQVDPSASYNTTHKKARGLLPPIPQTRGGTSRSPSATNPANYPGLNGHGSEMGHVTELVDGSPHDVTSPNLRHELETNPQERMMQIINDHNATNSSNLDLPGAAELVANAPKTLDGDQRTKLVNFMAGQSSSPATSTPIPVTSTPSMSMPTMPSTSVSPPPYDHNATPSLSPIMQAPPVPPSLRQINMNHDDLDKLQRLQSSQESRIHEISSLLGPLSPSGRIPGVTDSNDGYFEAPQVDLDQYFDSNAFLNDSSFGGDGNDFNFSLDADGPTQALDPQHGFSAPMNGNNTPSPAHTEEIPRHDLGVVGSPDRGTKRRRVG